MAQVLFIICFANLALIILGLLKGCSHNNEFPQRCALLIFLFVSDYPSVQLTIFLFYFGIDIVSGALFLFFFCKKSQSLKNEKLRACLHGGGGPQVGEVTCDGSPYLSCKRDQIKRLYEQAGYPT